jgi:hypothetical protein
MTKVWFVRDGPEPTRGEPKYTLPLDQCTDQLGLTKKDWLHALDQTPRFGDQAPRPLGMAEYRHVICQIDAPEASEYGWRPGYYVLEISPKEVAERLWPPEVGRNPQ